MANGRVRNLHRWFKVIFGHELSTPSEWLAFKFHHIKHNESFDMGLTSLFDRQEGHESK